MKQRTTIVFREDSNDRISPRCVTTSELLRLIPSYKGEFRFHPLQWRFLTTDTSIATEASGIPLPLQRALSPVSFRSFTPRGHQRGAAGLRQEATPPQPGLSDGRPAPRGQLRPAAGRAPRGNPSRAQHRSAPLPSGPGGAAGRQQAASSPGTG